MPETAAISAFGRLLAGDEATLARALTLLEAGGPEADALAHRLRPRTGHSTIVGFTGPPGAGKSTLISAFISLLRAEGRRVAVLAVDPSSPISGGAVLGDRTRMGAHTGDPGVFIRSVASRGHLGGLSLTVPPLLDAMDAAGWPTIVLETVGAGQSETEIVDFADVKVVLNAPGLGDDVQTLKAGVLEIADVLVINKSDLPAADLTRTDLEAMVRLRSADRPAPLIVSTSAVEGAGIAELAAAVDAKSSEAGDIPRERVLRRLRASLTRSAEAAFRARLDEIHGVGLQDLCGRVVAGEITTGAAVDELVAACSERPEADHAAGLADPAPER